MPIPQNIYNSNGWITFPDDVMQEIISDLIPKETNDVKIKQMNNREIACRRLQAVNGDILDVTQLSHFTLKKDLGCDRYSDNMAVAISINGEAFNAASFIQCAPEQNKMGQRRYKFEMIVNNSDPNVLDRLIATTNGKCVINCGGKDVYYDDVSVVNVENNHWQMSENDDNMMIVDFIANRRVKNELL